VPLSAEVSDRGSEISGARELHEKLTHLQSAPALWSERPPFPINEEDFSQRDCEYFLKQKHKKKA
jgi:hypothetical protein